YKDLTFLFPICLISCSKTNLLAFEQFILMLFTVNAEIFTFSFEELIKYGGLLIILVILFLETGLLVGLLVPVSDAVLFAAGLLCGTKALEIPLTLLLILAVFA